MESKFLDIINSLKNIPKTFLWMLACLPWVLSITYIQELIPSLAKYMKDSSTMVPVMWIASLASMLLLIFEAISTLFSIGRKKYQKIQDDHLSQKSKEQKICQNINKLMNLSNYAKKVLCDLFEEYDRGDHAWFSMEKSSVLMELSNASIIQVDRESGMHNGFSARILYDSYDLLDKDGKKIFNLIKNSIPQRD